MVLQKFYIDLREVFWQKGKLFLFALYLHHLYFELLIFLLFLRKVVFQTWYNYNTDFICNFQAKSTNFIHISDMQKGIYDLGQ